MKKLILTGLVACSLLLTQSCSKKESLTVKGLTGTSSKLKVRDVYLNVVTVPTGTYKFITCGTNGVTNKTIGINSSYNPGDPVQQVDYTINTGSDWRVTALGNGYYSIINALSNMALTLSNAGAAEHTVINQFGYGGIDAQQWKIEYSGGFSVYRIESKVNILKGAHVDPYQTTSGTPVTLQTYPTANPSAGYFLISPVVVSYQDQVATNFFRRTSGMTATDGSASFVLSDGRVFWGAGDSHYNDYSAGKVNCLFNKRSIACVQSSTSNWDWTQLTTLAGTTGTGYYLAPGDTFTWPGTGGFQVGSTVYIFTGHAGGTYPHMASINTTTLATTGYTTLSNISSAENFGCGMIKETDGYVYVFGERPIPPLNIGGDLLVARFPQSNPTAAWVFWNGSWTTPAINSAQATSIASIASRNFTVCKFNNKYVITGSEFSPTCDANLGTVYAYASTSNSPTSLYGTKKVIYHIPDRLNGHIPIYYGVTCHPEFNANNELLIFYSVGNYGTCVATCVGGLKDPDLTYRPKGVRVPFSLIDPAL